MPHATCPSAFMVARNTRNASLSSCRVLNDSAADLTAKQTQVINSRVEHLVNFKCLLAQFTISHMAKGKVHKDSTETEPRTLDRLSICEAEAEL